jgi:GDPmannose 4,6-dehydratase
MSTHSRRPKALICGVSGQDGAYLSKFLLSKGYDVTGTSRDSYSNPFNALKQLGVKDQIKLVSMSPTDFRSVLSVVSSISPDEVYNLSGQSSVGLSFMQPVETLESIATGTLNILEVIRFLDRPVKFYNAGSGECFGDTRGLAANENTAFHPRSPYAVAKSTAYWQVCNYRESYDLFACSGILFNHESPLRPGRFVTKKIIDAANRISKDRRLRLTLGNLDISRDWGWAPEYVEAMWRMLQQDTPDDFVIATGEYYSLKEFVEYTFSLFDLNWENYVKVDATLFRPSDIMVGFGDNSKAKKILDWQPSCSMHGVIDRIVAQLK